MQQLAAKFTLNQDIDTPHILIHFQYAWSQEDIDKLAEYLLAYLPDHRVIEHAYGADLETFHISYQQHEYLLNFEFYSQSCWLEVLNNQDVKHLHSILTRFNVKK